MIRRDEQMMMVGEEKVIQVMVQFNMLFGITYNFINIKVSNVLLSLDISR